MKTMERTRQAVRTAEATDRRGSTGRQMWIILLVGLLALIVGGVGGYLIGGSDDPIDAAIVLAGDGDLTARQEQMVELIDESVAAWQQGNGDDVVALFTERGIVEVFGTTYRVDDGSLARFVENGFPTLETHSPVLVRGNTALLFHSHGGRMLYDVIEFTSTGELLMVAHTMSY